jgi:hypothetical protein
MVDRDGIHRRVMLEGKAGEKMPSRMCWSPDEKWLAVTPAEGELKPGETMTRLEVVDLDGKTLRAIDLLEVPGTYRVVIDWR